jgi:hypothetical protein
LIGGCLAFWNDIFGGRTDGRSSLSGGADGWKERCIYVYKSMGYLVKENHVKVLVPITDW